MDTVSNYNIKQIQRLKSEAIDRINAIVCDFPKYTKLFNELILNFTIDDMMNLINLIYKDKEFRCSLYYKLYNEYFDEIEDFIYKMQIV